MSTKLNLVELPSATGQTPLFSAARSFNPANVKLLLKEYKGAFDTCVEHRRLTLC